MLGKLSPFHAMCCRYAAKWMQMIQATFPSRCTATDFFLASHLNHPNSNPPTSGVYIGAGALRGAQCRRPQVRVEWRGGRALRGNRREGVYLRIIQSNIWLHSGFLTYCQAEHCAKPPTHRFLSKLQGSDSGHLVERQHQYKLLGYGVARPEFGRIKMGHKKALCCSAPRRKCRLNHPRPFRRISAARSVEGRQFP